MTAVHGKMKILRTFEQSYPVTNPSKKSGQTKCYNVLWSVDFPLNFVDIHFELCVPRETQLMYLYLGVSRKPHLHSSSYIYRKQKYGMVVCWI